MWQEFKTIQDVTDAVALMHSYSAPAGNRFERF
jgi:hypothetical protein